MRILKSKKGVALETAILFILVIFSFCFLISTASMLGAQNLRTTKIRNEVMLEREQLAEDFLDYVAHYNDPYTLFANYAESKGKYTEYVMEESLNADGVENRIKLTLKKNGEAVLYLSAEKVPSGANLLYCRTTGQ